MNNKTMRILLLIVTIVYVFAPDLMPGPVDDIIVILLNLAAQRRLDPQVIDARD